ncbi:MAG: hypothetical protein J6T00_01670 [Bacteroidaceae bacterium]|nr:hypothetical protein [Bacteroidaceae bacterium]
MALDGLNPWTAKAQHNAAGNKISGKDLLDDITNPSKRATRMNAMKNFFSLTKSFDVTIKSNLDKATLMLNDVKIPTGHLEGAVFAPAGASFLRKNEKKCQLFCLFVRYVYLCKC